MLYEICIKNIREQKNRRPLCTGFFVLLAGCKVVAATRNRSHRPAAHHPVLWGSQQPTTLSCGVASIAFVLPGHPKSGRRCAPRGVLPLSPRPERSGSNDQQKENDSHSGAGDGVGEAEAGASGQMVRPVPVRVSPAGRRGETLDGVPQPAVP